MDNNGIIFLEEIRERMVECKHYTEEVFFHSIFGSTEEIIEGKAKKNMDCYNSKF